MRRLAAVIPLVLLTTAPTKAAVVIETYEFSATITNGDARIPFHQGSLSFSYDSTLPFNPTLLSVNFSLGGIDFDLTNTAIAAFDDGWVVGGILDNPNPLFTNRNFVDWYVMRSTPATQFFYTVPPMLSGGMAFAGTMSIQQVPNTPQGPGSGAVPEPGTWAMLLFGFGFIGSALRTAGRRQTGRTAA